MMSSDQMRKKGRESTRLTTDPTSWLTTLRLEDMLIFVESKYIIGLSAFSLIY